MKNMQKQRGNKALLTAAGFVCLTGSAFAQGLMSTQGVIVATDGDTVPDYAGAPMSGFVFGGSSALGDNCVLDETGNVLFRARFVDSVGATTTTYNDRALFYGSSRATLTMVARGGDQAPGLSPGVLLRTASGSSTSISATARLAPNGTTWWGTTIWDSVGTAVPPVTSSNDDAIFGGPIGAQTLILRQGDPAPGTVGATFVQAFSSPSFASMGVNRNGDCYFQGSLTGGDVMGTSNQQGIFAGPPASLTLVQRKGTACDGLPGLFVSSTSSSALGFAFNMNDAGQVAYELNLDLVVGAPLPVASNDHVIMLYTPGFGSAVIAREGDVVPGTSGCTFNAVSGDAWSQGISGNFLTRSGDILFTSTLRGGDVSGTQNDLALFRGSAGTLAMVLRKGDPAPGTDATFSTFNNTNTLHNDAGMLCVQGALTGGTSIGANDTGIWVGLPNALQLVVREGDVMPGTGGSIAGGFSGTAVYFNDQGRALFNVTLNGGTTTGSSLWMWDPSTGLTPIVLNGDQVEIAPSVFKTVSGFGGVSNSNTDGASLHFGHDGTIGQRIGFSDGTSAIMILHNAPTNPAVFCGNDTLGTDHTTACPCGNAGLPGNGCGHSFDPNGAHLGSTGTPSLDDVVLASSFTPASSFTLFLQHDTANDAVFHDGVICAGGTLIRLRGRAAVAGLAFFPNSNFAQDSTTTLSQRGSVTVGSGARRYYAAWYRNASTTFCPPATANVTNGLRIDW